MTASASPSPVYLDGRRIVVAAGREPRSPRDALIDVVRKYVVGRGDDDAVERFIDHVESTAGGPAARAAAPRRPGGDRGGD